MLNSKNDSVSCQLSFYPLGTKEYINDIQDVLKLIERSGLTYTIGEMSTVLLGSSKNIFALLEIITETMNKNDCQFSMSVTISNTCGICETK